MKKAELIKALAEKTGTTQKASRETLDAFVEVITDGLVEGKAIPLSGVGKFETYTRAARKGHNPSTGEPIDIPEAGAVRFKASSVLKDLVR